MINMWLILAWYFKKNKIVRIKQNSNSGTAELHISWKKNYKWEEFYKHSWNQWEIG